MPDLNIPHGSMPAELQRDLEDTLDTVHADENTLEFVGDCEMRCGPNRTIELHEPVWEDLRVAVTAGRTGASNPPTFAKFIDNGAASVGVYAADFAYQANVINEEQLWFDVQIPHSYKLGTDIWPHIHWGLKIAGAADQFVRWGLEYTWACIGDTITNTSIIHVGASSAVTATVQGDDPLVILKHYMSMFPTIDGSSIDGVSSMLLCRLFRNSSHGDDDLIQTASAFEIDFHYQRDTMGSRQQAVK